MVRTVWAVWWLLFFSFVPSGRTADLELVGRWPEILRTNTTGNANRGMAVSGNFAYLADSGEGLQIIDVSNPSVPVRVGHYQTNRWFGQLRAGYPSSSGASAVAGHYAYVAGWEIDTYRGLQVIDVSNPADPVRVGGSTTGGPQWDLVSAGFRLWGGGCSNFRQLRLRDDSLLFVPRIPLRIADP